MNTHTSAFQPGPTGRRARWPWIILLSLLLGPAGCEFLNPTQVENPQTTDRDLATASEPVRALMPGVRAQFARMVGSQVVISEVTSDNFSIHSTGISTVWDDPRTIRVTDLNATSSTQGIYWNMQELRALVDFVLDEIVPADPAPRPVDLAEAHYYRGMAFILLAENFTFVPLERNGPLIQAQELLNRAVTDLNQSLSLEGSGEIALAARAGLARAHRGRGDATLARQEAEQALDDGGNFVFQQGFDASSVDNQPHIFLVLRPGREMQPLPRLDFLDPKYTSREAGIAVAKAEEMHLILAEAALADGDLGSSAGHIADAIALARSRATVPFVDMDPRQNFDLTPRPRSSDILVRADPESPFRAGLVLDRPGVEIPVPVISGTSLDADSVRALVDEDEVWHAFHLARQEILFLEGRRMSDLGIRLPMMLREIDQHSDLSVGDPGTERVVPAYIPPDTQMNLFDPMSPGPGDTEVTIRLDMNRILAANRVNAFN